MCRAITCSKCKKPSWAGCGAHVEMVLAHVPPADRCSCPPSPGILAGLRRLIGL
ncbi:MAG: hypothetical protein ABI175_10345 [Polyangiales bacterium]